MWLEYTESNDIGNKRLTNSVHLLGRAFSSIARCIVEVQVTAQVEAAPLLTSSRKLTLGKRSAHVGVQVFLSGRLNDEDNVILGFECRRR